MSYFRLVLLLVTFIVSPVAAVFAQQASGPIWVEATPANASHAAGTSVGGLFKVTLAGRPGGSGFISGLGWVSTGGSTGALVIRAWSRNPVSTTCTDNAAFAANATDDRYRLPGFPMLVSPVPAVGDTSTYGDADNLNISYRNTDSPPGNVIYVCVVAAVTDAADANELVRLTLSGSQN